MIRTTTIEREKNMIRTTTIDDVKAGNGESVLSLLSLIERHGVDVHDYLDRSEMVPVLSGLQFQGDVAVIPVAESRNDSKPIPAAGIPVVRGESGGNTHLLLADGAVMWAGDTTTTEDSLDLGVVTVPEGASAWLAHPEHGYLGIAPGSYTVRRQREQADIIRLVQD